MIARIGLLAAVLTLTAGCLRYLTHDRNEALIEGVDIDQTLEVAKMDLEEGGTGSVLTLWAIRDQHITISQAARVEELYFEHVDSLDTSFDVWHFTWAISNMYRLGGEEVKEELQRAYEDATERAAETHGVADTHVNGDELYMGLAHSGGRAYAHEHVVVPGNPEFVQSVEEYRRLNDK
jgi:hypothetical protein